MAVGAVGAFEPQVVASAADLPLSLAPLPLQWRL